MKIFLIPIMTLAFCVSANAKTTCNLLEPVGYDSESGIVFSKVIPLEQVKHETPTVDYHFKGQSEFGRFIITAVVQDPMFKDGLYAGLDVEVIDEEAVEDSPIRTVLEIKDLIIEKDSPAEISFVHYNMPYTLVCRI